MSGGWTVVTKDEDFVARSLANVFAAGAFTNVSGTLRSDIVRLNSDGAIDTTFVLDPAFDGHIDRCNSVSLHFQ